MSLPHNQSSLRRAAEYLRDERNLPAAAGTMDEAADVLGPDSMIVVPNEWQQGLESPFAAEVFEVVAKFREKVQSDQ